MKIVRDVSLLPSKKIMVSEFLAKLIFSFSVESFRLSFTKLQMKR